MKYVEIIKSINKSLINNTVKLSGTTSETTYDILENLLNWEENIYHSILGDNNYVRFDFMYKSPYIDSFKLNSAVNRDPYRWVLEGSKDGENFVELYKNDGVRLCETWGIFSKTATGCTSSETKTYTVKRKGVYGSIRFRQTGKDSNNNTYLVLRTIEFIGTFDWHLCTCKCRHHTFSNIIFISLLLSH